MENIEEKACLCALNRIFGFEPKIGLALINHLGSAREVFRLSTKDLDLLTGPYFKYKGQICMEAVKREAEELAALERKSITFCGYTEGDYPALLKECEDAPIGIYIRSSTPTRDLWKPTEKIGIVGTRDITSYGSEWCEKVVHSLGITTSKPLIISGLALGTDIKAHTAALENGLPTIGVMATGPEAVYPSRHIKTAEVMASTPGCALITDYPPGTAPLAIHFLRRNRIIAGLSNAVILIESKLKGGGMTTCRLAYSYNREVYALPGRIDDLRSQGCNSLIRQKIAEPIASTDTLMEALGMKAYRRRRPESFKDLLTSTFGNSSDSASQKKMLLLLNTINKERGITIEEAGVKCGMSYKDASKLLGLLEIEGFICIDLLQRCSINWKNA